MSTDTLSSTMETGVSPSLTQQVKKYERELKHCDLEAAMFSKSKRARYELLRNEFVAQVLAWLHWINASQREAKKSLEEAYYEFKFQWYELKNSK